MALALLLGRLMLAAVFLAAGVAKLRDLTGSRRAVGEFGVPARAAVVLGTLLPLAELAIAGALIAGPTASSGALAALALLLLFCVAIAWNLSQGRTPDCHCFGQLHSSSASRRTVARNLGLAALAFLLAARLGALALAAAFAGAGIAALVAGPVTAWLRRRDRGEGTAGEDDGPPEGLPVGTLAPDFRLPDLAGGSATLDSLRAEDRPVLLLFSDPNCGACIEMAPSVARWQRDYSDELAVAVIERDRDGSLAGGPDEYGRRNVLMQRESEVADLYRAQGTPSAVVVGRDGAIASKVAAGSKAIEVLVARTVEGFEPGPASPPPARPGFTRPLARRELLARAAGAWATASVLLSSPLRAVAGVGSNRPMRRGAPCEDSFDCPDSGHMSCQNGRCHCHEGLTRCNPEEATTQRCFNLQTNLDHCGGCNHRCQGDDRCCNGHCTDVARDPNNCGGCNRPDLDQRTACGSNRVCRGGRCVPCPAGRRRCGNLCGDPQTQRCCGGRLYEKASLGPGQWACCNRRLVNLQESEGNCGECGHKCGEGRFCYQGRCRTSCPDGLRRCGNTCGDPRTQHCCNGSVVTTDDRHCGCPVEDCTKNFGNTTCCNGECVNTSFDARHCGGCNRQCPASEPICEGQCICPGGPGQCG